MRRRSCPQESVRWDAVWCDASGNEQSGEICDVSARGAFVHVRSAAVVPVGSRVRLRFATLARVALLDVAATVRWRGLSPAHRCHGIGLEFDGSCAELERFVLRESDAAYAATRSAAAARALPRYLTGKYPTLITVSCPAGESA